MQIEKTSAKGFISSISQSHPSIIIFHPKGDEYDKKIKSIQKIIDSLEKSMPKVYFYNYIINENEDNKFLAETLEIGNTLTAVLYKNGSFKRYQLWPIDSSNLRKLWGAAKDKPVGETTPRERTTDSEYITMEDI